MFTKHADATGRALDDYAGEKRASTGNARARRRVISSLSHAGATTGHTSFTMRSTDKDRNKIQKARRYSGDAR